MRKTTIILVVIFLCFLAYVMTSSVPYGHTVEVVKAAEEKHLTMPFSRGEKLTYEVIYNGVKVGRSILTFNGEKDLYGKKVWHVTFFTKIPSLRDNEEIYADKDTFLPIEVRRKIKKKIGFSDSIIEKYDQKNFTINISSKSKLRSKNFSIQKDSPVHNAILLTYYCRLKDDLKQGGNLKIALPTMDLDVMFSGTETVETDMGEFQADVFTSVPPKFRLWLSADAKRIPLKIKNPGTLGYSLIIKSID